MKKRFLEIGKQVLQAEAQAVTFAAQRLGEEFERACALIFQSQGKVIFTGLGKSGHIARKLSATFASTGTSALYLHPTEGLHGDFGVMQKSDVLFALAQSGETAEVMEVLKFAKRLGVSVIGMSGRPDSTLAQYSDVHLSSSVEKEACPLNLAPTASTAVMLALGDALAMALMEARGFSRDDFARLHPGGKIGRKLLRVKDLMVVKANVPRAFPSDDFHTIIERVTEKNFGIVPVTSEGGELLGAITDGDLRRALLSHGGEALSWRAQQFIKAKPLMIESEAMAQEALLRMQERKVTSLFVTQGETWSGLVRMHDLLAAGVM